MLSVHRIVTSDHSSYSPANPMNTAPLWPNTNERLISAVMGTKLPGFGCVVVKQTLEFPNPLYIDEEVTASVTLKSLRKALVVCDYSCITNDGKVVLRGEAKLVLPHNES
ncbi:hydroxyacyl-thioester dehydratase type 2, mitochondrial-like isoform X2 [Limulus polyphemus]|uniref:Hydroxyacyl-thioester dehydratase type 2, mitochondrial-like isoform X2 n=1 Tax=Limulus polyphemus TaxID=6850 RepID=A0ABM1T0I3_LIMPO|nr:hydroxyacyl-thioester dehydratase type 2, mitochondrial-like isoform X2 [Limulus polyphemus]XP_022249388.1 hydroxyacyl-thioester dehydratase type 2, mitochondrial-like isoform X2 [Limulus polyphemus]XP_022249389.1 hydroxyacyl-thioester dehydratase type 2, mitochondrial-like isoform X2 [Limulus polyphemus]